MAISLTACHHSSGEDNTVVTDVKVTTPNTLIVNLSKALPAGATLKYNNKVATSNTSTTYTFENVANAKLLELTGSTVIEQSTSVNFGSRNTVVMYVEVVEKTPGVTIVATSADVQVTDSKDDATSTAVLPASNTSALAGQNFNVQMFVPAQTPLTDVNLANGQSVGQSVNPYAFDCTPDGSTFTEPVKLTVELPGTAGADISLVNGNEKIGSLSGTTFTAEMTHFSVWTLVLNFSLTQLSEEYVTLKEESFTKGQASVAFQENFGYDAQAQGLIATTLRLLFGSNVTKVDKTYKLNATTDGSIVIKQSVKTFELTSGQSFKLTIKLYGDVTADITYNEPEVPSHVGGSN